jgi:SH3-like domain-containing protein
VKRSIIDKILCNNFLFILFLSITSGCSSVSEIKYQSEIDLVVSKWMTDKRESICDIKAYSEGRDWIIIRGETTIPQIKEEIINTLAKPGIILTDSIVILPDTTHNSKYTAVVTLSVANMRKEPRHSAELVSQAILGTPVVILKEKDSWVLVRTPDKYISWTEKSSLEFMDENEFNSWKSKAKAICIENSDWVYRSADESGVVGDLVSGAILEKTGESGKFVNIRFPDGREGVIRKSATEEYSIWRNDIYATADEIVNTAFSFLGLPYLWGGTSSKAVDCSGFIQSVFFRNGLILSRDASLQVKHGAVVDISESYGDLQKGDLLFFGTRNDRGDHVTHVALYIGDSEFIHASSWVMVNSLDSTRVNYSGFRKKSLLSARRIIGIEDDPGIVRVGKHQLY